jgi:hypothetical protein
LQVVLSGYDEVNTIETLHAKRYGVDKRLDEKRYDDSVDATGRRRLPPAIVVLCSRQRTNQSVSDPA